MKLLICGSRGRGRARQRPSPPIVHDLRRLKPTTEDQAVNTPHCSKSMNIRLYNEAAYPTRGAGVPQIDGRNTNLLLLISDDSMLSKQLRDAAVQRGLLVCFAAICGTVLQLRALRPGSVLLDLDLPSEAAWEVADCLLELESCPPLILVTARSAQFDVGIAVRAGTIVDKSAGPTRLLRLATEVSAQYESNQAERNAIQRIFIRWLRPSGWSVPAAPAHRFWRRKE